ncbi:DUF6241 domain-containing protein [Piscibacillus halophilus]|uniref:DUF6241 domain-containing protein n=1 Tax=Piscibacillus halophilus TaxID=571933 RepID=UPI00158B7492|nr:DUF6241 domain-containing protein [Piscibacillus halophilus]
MLKSLMKWLIGIVLVLGVGVGIFFGVGAYLDEQFTEDEPRTDDAEGEEEQRVRELSEEKFENSENDEDLNPFGDRFGSESLTDGQIQEYLHKMAHQKVEASEKWGFYLITDERIEWLQEGINESGDELAHRDLYESILSRWAAGDFSQADQDHNAIWELQGGTIGRATGVLSQQEEEAYINSAYED